MQSEKAASVSRLKMNPFFDVKSIYSLFKISDKQLNILVNIT